MRATLWRRYTSKKNREQKTTLLPKLGMARPDTQSEWHPAVAGVLMDCPHPERHLSSAWIQTVAYRGDTAVPDANRLYQLDAADLTEPLDRQVADACRFVARNMKVRASKRIGRVDLPEYNMTAVFEALVNAVAHRDYALHGGPALGVEAQVHLAYARASACVCSPTGWLDPARLPDGSLRRGRTDHPAAQQADSRQPAGLRIDRRQRTQADHPAAQA